MLSFSELLVSLEKSSLVAPEALAQLQQLHKIAPQQFTPRVALDWLVSEGQLTAAQVERLFPAAAADPKPAPAPAALVDPKPTPVSAPTPAPADDDLSLAPIDEEKPQQRIKRPRAKPADPPPPVAPSPPAAQPTPETKTKPETKPKPTASAPSPSPPKKQAQETASDQPLDDLFDDPNLNQPGKPRAAAAPAAKLAKKTPDRANLWESPLLMISAGALVFLCLLGGALWFLIGRESADESLRLADEQYRAGSYVQAIQQYDIYLASHPDHLGVSGARVRRGLSLLRQGIEGTKDWPRAFSTAKDVVKSISPETAFHEAHAELTAILPEIAEHLANRAREQPDQERVNLAREALKMSLNPRYVPESLRPAARLDEIDKQLGIATHDLNRDQSLANSVKRIRDLADAGQATQAYDERKQLLQSYPELRSNSTLTDAVIAATKALGAAVTFTKQDEPPLDSEAKSSILATASFARQSGSSVPGVDKRGVFVLAEGAAYGLDGATGKLRWRRFVGFDTDFVPRAISNQPDSYVLLVDSIRHELLCVRSDNGALRWRAVIDEAFDAQPVVLHSTAMVATRSGKLVRVDLKTGHITGKVSLPQPLLIAPAHDSRAEWLYQLADHSNLFVLSASDGKCDEVIYVGHEPGRVRVPPVVIGRNVLVAENRGAQEGVLHVLRASEGGADLKETETIRYQGHVVTPPLIVGRTVFVLTDRGALLAFEVSNADEPKPLVRIIERPPEEGTPLMRYAFGGGVKLWVTGRGLTSYEVQASRGRLAANWNYGQPDVVLAAPQLLGEGTLITVRRRGRLPGVTVAAVDTAKGQEYWQTELAVPQAAVVPSSSGDKLSAITTTGAWYTLAADALEHTTTHDAPQVTEKLADPLMPRPAIFDGGQALAFRLTPHPPVTADHQILIAGKGNKFAWLRLNDQVAAPPASFGKGLLVPLRMGQVLSIDPETGENLRLPFQPRLETGATYDWTAPVPLDNGEALIANGRSGLHRLGIADQPSPHLVSLADAQLQSPPVSRIAALPHTAYLVDKSGQLLAFKLPDLAPGDSWSLKGSPTWGPERIGDVVLVAAVDGKLLCMDDEGVRRWEASLPTGPVVGAATVNADELLVVTGSGSAYRLDVKDGRVLAQLDVGEPLSGNPLPWRGQWLLTGRDGSLFRIALPE